MKKASIDSTKFPISFTKTEKEKKKENI